MLLGRIGGMACIEADKTDDVEELHRRLRLIHGLARTERVAVAACAGYGAGDSAKADDGIDHHAVRPDRDPDQFDLIDYIAATAR